MSRVEKILQAMIDGTSYSEEPQSRVEAILLAIKNNTQYLDLPQSRIEEILLAIKNNTSYDKESMSRIEEILLAKLHDEEYTKLPQSRIEELLIELIKQEIEFEGVPPLTYKAIDGMLKNYRIYGDTVDGESVGDLVTSGEHAGEYKVPVTVEGKNLLQNTATSRTINGVTFTVNEDGSVTCNGTASNAAWFPVNRSFDLYAPEGRIVSIGNNGSMSTFYINISYVGNVTTSLNYSRTTHQNAYVQLVIAAGYTCDNLTFYPMIRKADIEDDTYEPYHAPITTNIYLPEQLRMVGTEADYIDYGEQKQHFADGTSVDVTLPALPTLSGTNTLSVGTTVQPSKVYIKGEFKEITTTYVQSIEPDNTNNKIIFVVRAYLSKNDRMVRTGLVATNDPAIGVNINVNSTVITSGCKVFVKEHPNVTPTSHNTKYTWTKTKVTDGEIWYVRSYVEYINSDNEQLIIYSDAAKASLDGII